MGVEVVRALPYFPNSDVFFKGDIVVERTVRTTDRRPAYQATKLTKTGGYEYDYYILPP